jgi:heparinase II/III-like protein
MRQELANLAMWWRPPRLPRRLVPQSPLPLLPPPAQVAEALRATSFPDELRRDARDILAHRFPIFGLTIDTGPEIHWRRDYVNGCETGCPYFRLVPYLNAAVAGDHKMVWELNRHQHLVLLAQLYLFDADPALLREIWEELESWLDANPFQRGINWASALEVAFRAFSWIWIYHLAGAQMPPALRGRFLDSLNQHGRHIEENLSFYFSPNTHLLGEATVLHALGTLFSWFPRARRWRRLGAKVVTEQLDRQVRKDGGYFEQSTYYHVYALDMFLFHGILADAGEAYRAKVALMADYLAAVQGPSRTLPFIGDDDGGRFWHPFGPRHWFGRATQATCAVWLGGSDWTYTREDLFPQAAWWLGRTDGSGTGTFPSRLFPDTGMAVMQAGDRHVLIDAGPFGPWGSGHSHSDTLSLIARVGPQEILIDPGTYTYAGGAERNWFRGSVAHNTVRVDELHQATPVNPFRWVDQPATSIREWASSELEDLLDAECVSRGITHRRQVRFIKPDLVLIVDEVAGPGAAEHDLEQFWHIGSLENRGRITLADEAQVMESWRSPAYGDKIQSSCLRVRQRSTLPAALAAAVYLGNSLPGVHIAVEPARILFHVECLEFPVARMYPAGG